LDAFEEVVIIGGAGSGFLVWVMLEDLFAVSTLDLVFSRFVAVLGETKNGVMILTLRRLLSAWYGS
jgi:hypothetical protein